MREISVMIVDDDPIVVNGLKLVVPWAKYGMKVTATALDGIEALEILGEKKADIVLVDAVMPRMDGVTLLQRLAGSGIYAIMISAHEEIPIIKAAIRNDAVDYLFKPVDMEELRAVLLKTKKKILGAEETRQMLERFRRSEGDSEGWVRAFRALLVKSDEAEGNAKITQSILAVFRAMAEGDTKALESAVGRYFSAVTDGGASGLNGSNLYYSMASMLVMSLDVLCEEKKLTFRENWRSNCLAKLSDDRREQIPGEVVAFLSDLLQNDEKDAVRYSRMMAASDEKVYAVSAAVGYKDIDYFTRVFKRMTGISPNAYRERNAI